MKDFQYFLDEVAKENSCNDWKYYFSRNKVSERSIREFTQEAAKRYAMQVSLETLHRAANRATGHVLADKVVIEKSSIITTEIKLL